MKKVLSLIIVFLGLSQAVKAGPGPTRPMLCLETGSPNRDSAYVDTNASSLTYQQYYCRNGYEVRFNYYVISSSVDTVDSILYFNWTNIDTSYPAIRSAFAAIDSLTGNFTIEKPFPYITDTSSFLNNVSTMPVIASHFDGYDTLLGRDVLEQMLFIYDGIAGQFTLAF